MRSVLWFVNLQCSRREALDSLHIELLNGSVPDMAVLGAGCSLATEAVGQQARYYSLPVVRMGWV